MLKPNKAGKAVESKDFVATKTPAKTGKDNKPKKKNKKAGFFKRIGMKFKDIFSELKKVSWPTFLEVLKKTGIVLAVVLVFLIVITAFDFGLSRLLGLITK